MKTKIAVIALLILLFGVFVSSPIFAQEKTNIHPEVLQELNKDITKLNQLWMEFQERFMTLTPEEQQEALQKLTEEFGRINAGINAESKK